MRTLLVAIGLLGSACGDNGLPAPKPEAPGAPAQNDPAFTVSALKHWYLIGDGRTPGDDQMTILVDAPPATAFVDAYVGTLAPIRLDLQPSGQWGTQLSIAELAAGDFSVLLSADGSDTAFAAEPFAHSYPLYVMVSTDWDFSDPGTTAISYQDNLHQNHPGMRITHFVGPYTFTDPAVTAARQAELVTWLVTQRDTFQDEIGLHIHPYCNFVTDAGLTCITDQSTVYAQDLSGYTIEVSAYGRTDFGTLLDHASDLFAQHGLNRPDVFRAGGWTATIETLEALADKGYKADGSALNWARIEEWKGKLLYTWNMEHWAPIGDTSQPWWPSHDEILSNTGPALPLLEVPDNGVMIDYVTLPELTGIFDANFSGAALAQPTTMMMGFHPSTSLSLGEIVRVDGFLTYAEQHLATRDLGPVVYTTLGDVIAAFPAR